MSAASVTFRRTFGLARNHFSTGLAVAAFLAASSVALAFGLDAAEGRRVTLVGLWAGAVAPFLPALVAFLAMDVWSDERRSGRMDILLSIAVRERDLTWGKFLGVWTMAMASVVLHLAVTLVLLAFFASDALSGLQAAALVPALAILCVQGALWSAVSVAFSAVFSHAAAAACASVVLTTALPRGLWKALQCWAPQGRTVFGEMPLDAHVQDFASGVVSVGTLAGYAVFTVLGLFVAVKMVAVLRFAGKGGRLGRASTGLALLLAGVASVSLAVLAMRFDVALDLPFGSATAFSARTRTLLSESAGNLTVTAFLSRSDAEFRSVSRFLRALRREAEASGGSSITLRYVDPRWDLGPAERLIRLGVKERSVIFEKGRRFAALPLLDDFGERSVAGALQSVALPPQRRDVYWVSGHGESAFDAYGPWGMSDIARELAREGYRNRALDLSQDAAIPADCALLVVAGAKDDFSRTELSRVDAYLKSGGRLLVLVGPPGQGGVVSLLPAWGIRPFVPALSGVRTLSGSDVIVSEFADHAVSSALTGSRIVLERPLAFASSAVAESGAGADRIEFSALARVGAVTVAAAVERGAGAGSDLAIRPTRIVIIGDASFALNGQLSARANANRDFFLNAVAYLSGTDVVGASGQESAQFSTGMDRQERARFFAAGALVIPAGVFLLLVAVALRRRFRT